MKKILIFLFCLFVLTGCGKQDTPTNEVQKLFKDYNSLTSDVLIQLDTVMASENLSDESKSKYKDVLKRQYEDLKYKINDEIISDDKAIVSTQVEVYNLRKIIDDAEKYKEENNDKFYENNKLNEDKFWNYKLSEMAKAKERVTYTIDFSLTKIDNEWHLDELLETDRQKIHGLYK